MTNNKAIIMLFALSTILITGGLTVAPAAYSSGNNDDSHDDSNGGCNDDSHDDSNGDCIPDPCDCKRPDTFKVRYAGPGTSDNPVTVEIYKKTSKLDKGPILTIEDVFVGDPNNAEEDYANQIVVSKSNFNKDKLNSNIGYRILFEGAEIAVIDIHVSCSDQVQMLYIGQTFTVGDVTLTIEDGTRGQGENEKTSIPISNPLTCEAPPEPTKFETITLKKALTNDNGGTADPTNFGVSVITDAGLDGVLGTTDDVLLDIDGLGATEINFMQPDPTDPSMGVLTIDVPVPGDYALVESVEPTGYTTVLIAGDTKCPSMENEFFTMKEGKGITCTIYNDDDFVEGGASGPNPTVFVNSTIIDRSLRGLDFLYTVGSIEGPQGNNTEFEIDANTPAFFLQTNNPDNLPTRITGDGNCPEVLIGVITLSSGQNITCTLEYGIIIEPGVVFHNNNIVWSPEFTPSGSMLGGEDCSFVTDESLPCVAQDQNGLLYFADPLLPNTGKTLVLFNALGGLSFGCTVQGIEESGTTLPLQIPARMHPDTLEPIWQFIVECNTPPLVQVNFNYAFIETE